MRFPTRRFRRLLAGLGLALALPGGYASYLSLSGNVHTVEPGLLYRSAQLGPQALGDLIDQHGIRTIINLRGVNSGASWYREEAALAAEKGLRYIPIRLSARSLPDLATMVDISDALRMAPRPILVHCLGGSDRTGLAAAIFDLVVKGETAQDAADQLSLAYGHFPWLGSQTAAMDRAFAEFAAYWREGGREIIASRD